jgi:purine-nucleoside phosphorylase
MSQDMHAAVAAIRSRWKGDAAIGVILGTGLGELAEEVAAEAIIPYRDVPGFPHSTALAHKGRLVCGTLAGQAVVMLQGRCHLYEGYPLAAVTFPTRVLHALGIRTLILTNAAGGINPQYSVGDVMLIDDHINLLWRAGGVSLPVPSRDLQACGDTGELTHPARHTRLYDAGLATETLRIARAANFPLHRGVYVAVTGPSYETRAEYRAFRRIGGDCVGMSTVPEVLTASMLGIRVLGLSTVTNVARPDAPQTVSAEEVVHVAATALPKVRAIVHGLLSRSP